MTDSDRIILAVPYEQVADKVRFGILFISPVAKQQFAVFIYPYPWSIPITTISLNFLILHFSFFQIVVFFNLLVQFLICRKYGSFEIVAVDPKTVDDLHTLMGIAVIQQNAVATIITTA